MKSIIYMFLLVFFPLVAAAESVTITAVGDIMLAGSGEKVYAKKGYDYPFDLTRDILKRSDVVTGNLEAPLTSKGSEFKGKKFRFKSSPAAAAALKNAGFTYLSLANNHIMDFGPEGLLQTLDALDSCKIGHSGAGPDLSMAREARLVTVKGVRIAFLSYSMTFPDEFYASALVPGTAPGYGVFFTADIKKARKNADCVIVSFHWGGEGKESPRPYQVTAAHLAVDAGADIIIGHHPHVLQGVEYYRKGLILYSLGNFAFGSTSRTSDRSMIARIVFDSGIAELEIIPLNVLNGQVRFQPSPLYGRVARETAEKINSLSKTMGSRVEEIDGRFIVQPKED